MRKILTVFLFALLFALLSMGLKAGNAYTPEQRYNDSLRVFNTYKNEIAVIKSIEKGEYQKWFDRQAADDSVTACAKRRLQVYNRHTYEPSQTFEREGLGEARAYPVPSSVRTVAEAVSNEVHPVLYTAIDYQTHFITYSNGRTRIPFIQKFFFENGQLLYAQRLDPITFEKLPNYGEAPASTIQASNSNVAPIEQLVAERAQIDTK